MKQINFTEEAKYKKLFQKIGQNNMAMKDD